MDLSGLLRPGARLSVAGEGRAGHLGGSPELPPDAEWPVWPGHGPLTFVASVNCAALSGLDIPLPEDGTLLFFFFDGQFDDDEALVYCEDPDSMAGARVIYVPAGATVEERPTPEGLTPYPRLAVSAEVLATTQHRKKALAHEFLVAGGASEEEAAAGAAEFERLANAAAKAPWHQIGGFASPVQGPVELEVAKTVLGVPWGDPQLEVEAAKWVLLAQVDSQGDMMWGDSGALYWLIRPEDLAARRFEQALFTWQCC
jgi:uncharacterized protein YwqG